MTDEFLFQIPNLVLSRLDVGWTIMLLLARYGAFMLLVPGIGGGLGGLTVRYPAVVMLALVTLDPKHTTAVPVDLGIMAAQIFCEVLLGSIVGMVPLLIISGASTAGQIASSAMGLTGAQLFDPTTSSSITDLSRIYTDLTVVLFLLMNGHHIAIAQLAGLDGVMQPGSFVISGIGIQVLIDQSSKIFEIGVMIASPIIVALFLTNFVMGLMSKVVASFNVFIISFPLTIGIGLILTMLALPEVVEYLRVQILDLEMLTRAVRQ